MIDDQRQLFQTAVITSQMKNGFPPANFARCKVDGRYLYPELEAAWWGWRIKSEQLIAAADQPPSTPSNPTK